jgi:uncharacterized membrane protein
VDTRKELRVQKRKKGMIGLLIRLTIPLPFRDTTGDWTYNAQAKIWLYLAETNALIGIYSINKLTCPATLLS